MCGISGLVNCGDAETLARMTDVQSHRGPDDSGLWERHFSDGTYIGLGSRRLAILDLSPDGHMPMSNEDGSVWITYNGEIYNFADLRRELEGKGHRFRSHTDTEAIVHLYEEYGVDCLNRLNGMFAFAICDLRGSAPKLFLARDHFGIKPLYYSRARRQARLRLRGQSAARSAGHRSPHEHGGAASIPDLSLGARSRDDVRGNSQARCRSLRDLAAAANSRSNSIGI